jgi:large subunit ribosomal protein L31e
MSSSAEGSLSRIYTINLGKAWLTPRYRRTDRVVNMIREFAEKHMKTNEVKLDQELNRHVWKKGKANPPRRLRVRMTKDEDGIVIVSPYEEAITKESDNSEATDDLEQSQEPLPEKEMAQNEKLDDQSIEEKEPKESEGKKDTAGKKIKGKKQKSK